MPVRWANFLAVLTAMCLATCVLAQEPCREEPLVAAWEPPQGPVQTVPIDDQLVVSSEQNEYDPVRDVFTFRKGVVARYGPTTIRTEVLTVDRKNQSAEALGSVELLDPDGQLQAEKMTFSWQEGKRTGRAENIRAKIANVYIRARLAVITPGQYELFDIAGSSCSGSRPLYELRSRHLTVTPGESGKAERPTIYVLNQKILRLPDRRFALDRRTEGLGIPSLSVRRDVGVGVTWGGGFLINPTTNINFALGAYNGVRPGYGIVLAKSFLPAKEIADVVTPRSEFGERFRFGYLENIRVKAPLSEVGYLQTVRRSASIGSQWNQGVVGRERDTSFSKPIELTFETSGPIGGAGYFSQLRFQAISRGPLETVARVVGIGSYVFAPRQIAPRITSIVRLDSTIYGGDPSYGWLRGMFGAAYQPFPQLTLAAGTYQSVEVGTARFATDPLYAKAGLVVRADARLGATTISLLSKYDRDLGNFDFEYYVSQVVGCLEPFVQYRRFPSDYQFGLRLRLAPFYDTLRRRDFRGKGTRTVISGPRENAAPGK